MTSSGEWIQQPNGSFKKRRKQSLGKEKNKWITTTSGFKKIKYTQLGIVLQTLTEQIKHHQGHNYVICVENIQIKMTKRYKKETRIPHLILKIIPNETNTNK